MHLALGDDLGVERGDRMLADAAVMVRALRCCVSRSHDFDAVSDHPSLLFVMTYPDRRMVYGVKYLMLTASATLPCLRSGLSPSPFLNAFQHDQLNSTIHFSSSAEIGRRI
jgi:hypothetical protein